MSSQPIPYTLPNYQFDSFIGDGNSGVVYTARRVDQNSDTQQPSSSSCCHGIQAVKLIPVNKFSSAIRREISLHHSLSHPNIISLHHVGIAYNKMNNSTPSIALVMEYASQRDLFAQVSAAGSLPCTFVRRRLQEIASALNYLHEQNIVHLDIKLENVVLTQTSTAKLIDFGCARRIDEPISTDTTLLGGTLHYLAPETIVCMTEERTAVPTKAMDSWALGVLLYTALVGRYPFSVDENDDDDDDDSIDEEEEKDDDDDDDIDEEEIAKLVKHKIVTEQPDPFPSSLSIPSDLTKIVFGLLEKDAQKRMTIAQVLEILKQTETKVSSFRSSNRFAAYARRRQYQQSTGNTTTSSYRNYITSQYRTPPTCRARTPSPSSPVDADFSSKSELKIPMTKNKNDISTECPSCRKQSVDQVFSIIDQVMNMKKKTSSNNIKIPSRFSSSSSSSSCCVTAVTNQRCSSSCTSSTNGHGSIFPFIDSIISNCSVPSSHCACQELSPRS